MGTHPIFESDFDCLTEYGVAGAKSVYSGDGEAVQGLSRSGFGRLHRQTVRRTGPTRTAIRCTRKMEKAKTRSHQGVEQQREDKLRGGW